MGSWKNGKWKGPLLAFLNELHMGFVVALDELLGCSHPLHCQARTHHLLFFSFPLFQALASAIFSVILHSLFSLLSPLSLVCEFWWSWQRSNAQMMSLPLDTWLFYIGWVLQLMCHLAVHAGCTRRIDGDQHFKVIDFDLIPFIIFEEKVRRRENIDILISLLMEK